MSPIDDIGNELDTVAPPPPVIKDPMDDYAVVPPPPVIVDPIEQPTQPPSVQSTQPVQQRQQRQQFNPYNYLMQQFQSYMRPPQYSPFGYGGRSMYGLGSYGMSPMMGYGGYGGYGMSPMMGYGGGYGSPFGGGLMSLFSGYMR